MLEKCEAPSFWVYERIGKTEKELGVYTLDDMYYVWDHWVWSKDKYTTVYYTFSNGVPSNELRYVATNMQGYNDE